MSGEKVKPVLSSASNPFAPIREAAETAIRNLGLTGEPPQISAEHWQRVLAAVETRMTMRGAGLPAGWAEELAVQMGRGGSDAHSEPES